MESGKFKTLKKKCILIMITKMNQNIQSKAIVHYLPTEILWNIFCRLTAKELMKCRQICVRWNIIIEEMSANDILWRKFCEQDFSDFYWMAKKKSKTTITWSNLYKSMYLWRLLNYASEEVDEFASASSLSEELRDVGLHNNGIVAAHVKKGIVYYDSETLKQGVREPLIGEFAKYIENENVAIIQTNYLHLYILSKSNYLNNEFPTPAIDNVKMFLLIDDTELYYVKLNDEIYMTYVNRYPIKPIFIKQATDEDTVMSLGYKNGCLNVLTYQRNIFSIQNKEIIFRQSLDSERNLLNILDKYNFLEQLDWRVYFQWMHVLNHSIPQGPLRDITIIRPYGDVYFVGSNFGVLCIFFAPYVNNELDIFNREPIRQINFMERSDIPVLETCPIIQIDVMEIESGHMVYVAMPKKVAVVKFKHCLTQPASWAVLPYEVDIEL